MRLAMNVGVLLTISLSLASAMRVTAVAAQNTAVATSDELERRDVALQEVRFAVEDATKGKEFEHRLMDYNNLPSTTFADIKRILKVATDRVSGRLAAQNSKKRP